MKRVFSKEILLQLFACDLLPVYGVNLEIDTNPDGAPNWVELGDGIDNITEALNEIVNQYFFLNKNGYGESQVTGMQPVMTLTGIRKLKDPAQNFIFDKKYELNCSRVTNMRLNYVDGNDNVVNIVWNNVTLANLQEFGGATTDGAAINVEIHSSEKPVVTGANLIELLNVVSVAGTTPGDTAIYVNPAIEGGNIYKYQVAASVTLPVYDQDMTALTTWNGTDEITAATGQEILIVECTAGNLARKAGKQTVTAL